MVELAEHWFEIADGEKRWRACKKIGLNKIKAIILEAFQAFFKRKARKAHDVFCDLNLFPSQA